MIFKIFFLLFMNTVAQNPKKTLIIRDNIPKPLFEIQQISLVQSNISLILQSNQTSNSYCVTKNRLHQNYFNYLIRKFIKNDFDSNRKKRQIAFLAGTILGFSVDTFFSRNHNSINDIRTEFHEKLNNFECALLSKLENIESRTIENQIRTEILNFKNQLYQIIFEMENNYHSPLTERILKTFCTHHANFAEPCFLFASKSKSKLLNKYINFEAHKVEVILEFQMKIPVKFISKSTYTEKIFKIPYFSEKSQKWLVDGKNFQLLRTDENITKNANNCYSNQYIHVCSQNTEKIPNQEKIELNISKNHCYIEKFQNILIIVKPKKLEGNFTMLNTKSEIISSNRLQTFQKIRFSNFTEKITVFCDKYKSSYFADKIENFQYSYQSEIISSLTSQESRFLYHSQENSGIKISIIFIIIFCTSVTIFTIIMVWYLFYKLKHIKNTQKKFHKSIQQQNLENCSICSDPTLNDINSISSFSTLPVVD